MLIRLYRRLLPFAKPYRGKMILSSIFNILSNAIGSVNLLALLPIVSVILGEKSMMPTGKSSSPSILERFSNLFLIRNAQGVLDQLGSLERICIFIFVTYALKNIFQWSSGYLMALVESGMARSLRDTVFEKLSKLSLDYYYDRKSGHLLSRLTNDVSSVNSTLSSSIMTLVGQPVQIVIFVVTMLVINVKMTFISIFIAALSLYLVRLFGGTIKRMSHRLQSLQG
ncbi:MAG: ABC transporter transmembrane domain-containing protein, partial [Candidatus Kapaibacterium sp.]